MNFYDYEVQGCNHSGTFEWALFKIYELVPAHKLLWQKRTFMIFSKNYYSEVLFTPKEISDELLASRNIAVMAPICETRWVSRVFRLTSTL